MRINPRMNWREMSALQGRFNAAVISGVLLGLTVTSAVRVQAQTPQPRGRDEAPAGPEVLARIGGEVITLEDFELEMKRRATGDSERFDEPAEREALLGAMLQRAAVIDAAKSQGYLQRPEIVAAVDRILFSRYVEEELDTRIAALPPITMADIEAHYQVNASLYERPARVQGAIVFLKTSALQNDEKRAETRAKAEALLAEAKSRASQQPHFGDIAQSNSEERASRYRGGVIGWLTEHPSLEYKWDPKVVEALFAIDRIGGFAPLVETQEGIYLVRMVDKEDSRPQPLAPLVEGIRFQLEETRRDSERTRFFTEILESRKPSIDRQLLEQLTSPSLVPEGPSEGATGPDGGPRGSTEESRP